MSNPDAYLPAPSTDPATGELRGLLKLDQTDIGADPDGTGTSVERLIEALASQVPDRQWRHLGIEQLTGGGTMAALAPASVDRLIERVVVGAASTIGALSIGVGQTKPGTASADETRRDLVDFYNAGASVVAASDYSSPLLVPPGHYLWLIAAGGLTLARIQIVTPVRVLA